MRDLQIRYKSAIRQEWPRLNDPILNFDEHRRRQDDQPGSVRCARCGQWIEATALRCSKCGVHFQGEAQDFVHPSERYSRSFVLPRWVMTLAAVVVVLLLMGWIVIQ